MVDAAANEKCNKALGGEPSWIRTSDLLIKSQLLYRLSYGPITRVHAGLLPLGLSARAVKAHFQVPYRQSTYRITPVWGDCHNRAEDKSPAPKQSVRDG